MKNSIKSISVILSTIILIGAAFTGGYFTGIKQLPKAEIVENPVAKNDLKLPGEVEKSTVTVEEIKSKLNESANFQHMNLNMRLRKVKNTKGICLMILPFPEPQMKQLSNAKALLRLDIICLK